MPIPILMAAALAASSPGSSRERDFAALMSEPSIVSILGSCRERSSDEAQKLNTYYPYYECRSETSDTLKIKEFFEKKLNIKPEPIATARGHVVVFVRDGFGYCFNRLLDLETGEFHPNDGWICHMEWFSALPPQVRASSASPSINNKN
jgi:hypothetical protein